MSRTRLFIILLVACCLSKAATGDIPEIDVEDLDGFDYTSQFYDLDFALGQRTAETTPEANFEAASQIYQDNLEDNIKPRAKIMKAIQLFLALRTIDQNNQCNFRTANLIEQNNRATDRKALIKDGGNLEHVAVVVGTVGKKHARECQQVYESRYATILSKMDKLKVSRVEEFLHDLIEQHTSDNYKSNVAKSLAQRYNNIAKWQINPTRKMMNPKFLYETLEKVVKDDLESKFLMPVYDEEIQSMAFASDEIYGLFEKYFVEPCKYYTQKLGHEVFDQRNFDGAFGEVNESNPEFYKAWAQYQLCSAFLERSRSIYSNFIISLDQKVDDIVKSSMYNQR